MSLSTVFLVIAIILIIVMGVLLYMQKIEADRQIAELENNASEMQETINDLQGKIDSVSNTINNAIKENKINNQDILGIYEYDVPKELSAELGNYYSGITIELLEGKKFKYNYGEGFILEGGFQIEENYIICNAKSIEGEYLNKQGINVKYTFEYLNNTLELTNKEGKVKFETSDYGIAGTPTEIKEVEETFEKEGSKYVKNIATSENSSDRKYSEITKTFGADERFFITEAINNNDATYTLKGVVYEKFTLTKSELEDAVKNGGYKYKNIYATNPEYVNYTVKKNYEVYDYAFIGKFNNEDRLCFYASKKDNNTYYIQNGTEYSDEWNLTDEYKQITVSSDTKCEYSLDSYEFKTDTVANVFSQKLYFAGGLGACFNFIFENGKCTSVNEIVTGH